MPNNFRHLGLIHLILPNAKIIDARREPMACCFVNFKQLFASGQQFTYSIEDIARYYRMYVELMAHWDARAARQGAAGPARGRWSRDLEGNVRRILDFCGLEFEPACLEFHRTERTRSHRKLRAGAPADLSGGRRPVAQFEPWLGSAQGRARSVGRAGRLAVQP